MHFFNVFQRFSTFSTYRDQMRCSMRRCEGHIWSNEGCCWFPASGCAAQNACRDMWCRVVPRWTVQKPCRAFLKRTNWKKNNFLDIRTDLCWEQRSGGVLVALLSFDVSTWPKWRSWWNVQGLENQHTERFLEQVAPGTLRYPRRPETARDVANLRSSQSQKFTKGFCFPLLFQAIPMGMSRMQKIMLSMLSWPMNANECQWAQSHLWKMLTISIDC